MFNWLNTAAFLLSVAHGAILGAIMFGIVRIRDRMLFAKAVFVIVSLYALFLFVNGIVSVTYSADVGLILGGAVIILVLREYFAHKSQSRHTPREQSH